MSKHPQSLASNSTTRHWIFKFLHKTSPPLIPHISATKLLVVPMYLDKPAIHSPCSSLTAPPHPDLLELPILKPSVFNFFQPLGGLSHRTLLITLRVDCLGKGTKCMNSTTWLLMTDGRFGFGFFPLKTNWFLLFYIKHTTKGKSNLQWGLPRIKLLFAFPFVLNQFWRLEFQNPWFPESPFLTGST